MHWKGKIIVSILTTFSLNLSSYNVSFGQSPTNTKDSSALVGFYDSTNGPHWLDNAGWLAGPVPNWYGVGLGVDSTGQNIVLQLGLVQDSLRGSIPSSIANFTNLTWLYLSGNQLSGSIPSSIWNMTSLSIMDLSGNQLTGNIPSSVGNLKYLQWLILSNNQLSGSIPSSIGNMTYVNTMNLAGNQLTDSIPSSIGNLNNLQELYLNYNNLSGAIPASILNLPLTLLYVNNNKLCFDGMEAIVQADSDNIFTFNCAPQDSIQINNINSILSVHAGGTLNNNTYNWYKNGVLDSTKVGDSTYAPNSSGQYYVAVTNSIVTTVTNSIPAALTLYGSVYNFADSIHVSLIDPNPSMINSDGTLSTNVANIDYSKIVQGGATDGITLILLVSNYNSALTFTLSNPNDGDLSTLSSPDNTNSTITVQPDNGKVVAVYTVPDGYGSSNPPGSRSINILVADPNNPSDTSTIAIKLVSPPVVLVHGMWSDPSVWTTGGFVDSLISAGYSSYPNKLFSIFTADYSKNSASTFDPYNAQSIFGRQAVEGAIKSGLSNYRNNQIAVTQVDVVGHSLGGLMARSYAAHAESFITRENYKQGYIHKLITLGTPHKGSPLGPLLWGLRNEIVSVPVPTLLGGYVNVPFQLDYLLSLAGKPIGLCHRDFDENSYAIQNNLVQTPKFYTYSIAGDYVGNITNLDAYTALNGLLYIISGKSHDSIFKISSCAPQTEPSNDIIVPRYSQIGGNQNESVFFGTAHLNLIPQPFSPAITETNSPMVQNKVAQLLLSDNTGDFGTGFIKASEIKDDCITPGSAQGIIQKKSTTNKNGFTLGGSGNLSVNLVSPALGSSFTQSNSTTINIQYLPGGGCVPSAALLMIENIGWVNLPIAAPYSSFFSLSDTSSIGRLHVVLLVRDTTGVILADTASIIITPNGTLDSIAVTPQRINLDSSARISSVDVQGYYSGGQPYNLADISSGSAGTVYSPQNGGVFSVSAYGSITAIKPGMDTLMVTNNGLSVKVPVTVDSNFLDASIYPDTINFPQIPDLFTLDTVIALSATSTSGDTISFTLISGNATLQNGIITITGAGPIKVKASQGGDAYFTAPSAVTQTFCVGSFNLAPITGDTLTCLSVKTYHTSNITGITYNWSLSDGGTITSNDSSITVTWNAAGNHIISVAPFMGGCSGPAVQLLVKVIAPPQPTITKVGMNLQSSADSGNQWFMNGTPIRGATDSVYAPIVSGNYTVQQTVDSCSSPLSDEFNFTNGSSDSSIAIYPNPFNNSVMVVNKSTNPISIQLYDLLGRKIVDVQNAPSTSQLNTTELAQGCYIILITDEVTKIKSRKLLVK